MFFLRASVSELYISRLRIAKTLTKSWLWGQKTFFWIPFLTFFLKHFNRTLEATLPSGGQRAGVRGDIGSSFEP